MDEKRLSKIVKQINRLSSNSNPKEKIDLYHEAGEICRTLGKYDQAIRYFLNELHQAQSSNFPDDILYANRFLGECYLETNQYHISEKYHLTFLTLAQQYGYDERIEQAYTCLANTYWLWLSYLQEDILYDADNDQLPRDLCEKSFQAAENSLAMIEKLENEKRLIKPKKQDLVLRRVRSYINIANAISERYINGRKDHADLQVFSRYIKNAVELSKKSHLYEELTRLHSSVSYFYLSIPGYLQYKRAILTTMKQAIHYAQLARNTNEYLSCLYDIAQTLISFDEYEQAKIYLIKINRFGKQSDHPIKEKAKQDLENIQHLLTGLEDQYTIEGNLRKKMSLAEQCADIYSSLNRPEQSEKYYLKQLKHAQELSVDENEMAMIYSSLGSVYQDLKQWQLSRDYFRREMSCRIGLGIQADIEQGYSLCEIIKCEYRLKIDIHTRMRTFERLLTLARSTNEKSLIRMSIALIFAMKLRDSKIILNDDLEEFMKNIQPPITEENYSDILRCTERINNIDDRSSSTDEQEYHSEKLEPSLITRDDIHRCDTHGWTPLHHAVDHQQLPAVRYLLDRKVNINAQTNHGLTPLMIACHHGCLEMIELLLTYAAKMDIRTNNGYTAVDYLVDCERKINGDERRIFNRLKELLLIAMRKDEPMYCVQRIIRSDFEEKPIMSNNSNQRIHGKTIRSNRHLNTDRRFHHRNRFSWLKGEKFDVNDNTFFTDNDDESIPQPDQDRSYSPISKRRCPAIDYDLSSSTDMDILHLDISTPVIKDPSVQLLTPRSTMRSRQASTTSSVNTTIVLSPPITSEINSRIIRCFANTIDRLTEDKKLRIPISPLDTITNLRYQILKRLYDNYHIFACSVTLYDRHNWEIGLSETDTIQFALPADECDIKAIYMEKDPLLAYETISREMNLIVYSNIRLVLKQFFDQFELSLERLSLKLSQAISILKIFENYLFIHTINLSENHLTDEIFDQLLQLTLDHLKTLNLSKNEFTSNGIRKLFEEKPMKKLLMLDLIDNINIDVSTVNFLRTRFPNLTIHH